MKTVLNISKLNSSSSIFEIDFSYSKGVTIYYNLYPFKPFSTSSFNYVKSIKSFKSYTYSVSISSYYSSIKEVRIK